MYANIIDIWEYADNLVDTVDNYEERYKKLIEFLYEVPIYEPGMICIDDKSLYNE